MKFFTAYFWKSQVFIEEKAKFATNEILTEYLNFSPDGLEELADRLRSTEAALNTAADQPELYRSLLSDAQCLFDQVRKLALKFPPYSIVLPEYFDEEKLPPEPTVSSGTLAGTLRQIFRRYILFLNDILRVHYVYSNFLDNYYHAHNRFPDEEEKVQAYQKFCEDHSDSSLPRYKRFMSSANMRLEYTTLTTEDGSHLLCKSYDFTSLGAFLYLDFFRGMRYQYIPKRCEHCGRYFLLESGKYSGYCERPLKDGSGRTCRDIGPRRKYDEKCRTDPVWLTYNRAYKAHYARYMKKKMTVAEFEQWSADAILLRDKASSGELSFEEFEQQIRI